MSFMVYTMLLGWPILSLLLYAKYKSNVASLYVIMLGTLFLPETSIPFPFFSELSKDWTIGISVILGSLFYPNRVQKLKTCTPDNAMILWCLIVPITTSLSNHLGLYDGLRSSLDLILVWGIPYWAGRHFLINNDDLDVLGINIITGGLIYFPLCLFEVRMSPQLSNIVYGFFPHSFLQHVRYGGYRPIIFMQHGLMVSLWMASTSIVSFWYWRIKGVKNIYKIPTPLIFLCLLSSTILCKSANGIVLMIIGITSIILFKKKLNTFFFYILLLIVPLYTITRIFNIIGSDQVGLIASYIFDDHRVSSLIYRLIAEELYGEKALLRPLFGWGGWNRNRPIDSNTGLMTSRAIDSIFLIYFSRFGFFGLITSYISMLLPPWKIFRNKQIRNDSIVFALVVVLFMIDSLINAMINQVYIMCVGVLVAQLQKKERG